MSRFCRIVQTVNLSSRVGKSIQISLIVVFMSQSCVEIKHLLVEKLDRCKQTSGKMAALWRYAVILIKLD